MSASARPPSNSACPVSQAPILGPALARRLRRFVFCGSSSLDAQVDATHDVLAIDAGIEIRLRGEVLLALSTGQVPAPGLKVFASSPIPLESLREFSIFLPGGGGLNQAKFFSSITKARSNKVQVEFVDSSAKSAEVEDACKDSQIRLISLARHSVPANVVANLPTAEPSARNAVTLDRVVVKSPLSFPPDCPSVDLAMGSESPFCLVATSPKCSSPIETLLQQNPAAFYFQPTGSLETAETIDLCARADGVVTNFDELVTLANDVQISLPDTKEHSPHAPSIAVKGLTRLWKQGCIGRHVAATTLGSNGCVVADFQERVAFHHRVELSSSTTEVSTRNGAGDRWLAEYVYAREVDGVAEPYAARAATARTGAWLGLGEAEFRIDSSRIPLRD